MAESKVLRGADVRIFISGNEYSESQSVQWTIDYGIQEIYGIDSVFPQEMAITRMSVQGNISGIIVKSNGRLQGHDIRVTINDLLQSPYTSLRIKDRHTDENLLWLPQMMVTNESVQVQTKGVAKLSFTFKGIIPYNTMDMA